MPVPFPQRQTFDRLAAALLQRRVRCDRVGQGRPFAVAFR